MAQKLIFLVFLKIFIVVHNIFQNEQKILKIDEMAFRQSWSISQKQGHFWAYFRVKCTFIVENTYFPYKTRSNFEQMPFRQFSIFFAHFEICCEPR